jgi:hypothetical protein
MTRTATAITPTERTNPGAFLIIGAIKPVSRANIYARHKYLPPVCHWQRMPLARPLQVLLAGGCMLPCGPMVHFEPVAEASSMMPLESTVKLIMQLRA